MTETVPDGGSQDDAQRVVRRAVIRYSAWSALVLVALVIAIVLTSRQVARSSALEAARGRVDSMAENLVAPLVTREVRDQVPGSSARLMKRLKPILKDGSVRHLRIWDENGTLLWSDEKALIGERFDLSDEVRSLFRTQRTVAHLSDDEGSEPDASHQERLVEVYAGTVAGDGEPLVFEAYLPSAQIRSNEAAIITKVMPAAIVALVLLQLAMIPIGVSLGRRVRSSEAARSRMTAHALAASELERRRIAHDLHDGVVQDLAAVGFTMPGLERVLQRAPDSDSAVATLRQVQGIILQAVSDLRSMMTEIYPPDLETTGVAKALDDLAEQRRRRGLDVTVEARNVRDLPLHVARLVYRVAREGLQNVDKHSQAQCALVAVDAAGDEVVVRVADDGRGVRPAGPVDPGHLGLRLLEDAIRDAGGALTLGTAAEPRGLGGALLEARIPCG